MVQHICRNDPLNMADDIEDSQRTVHTIISVAIDIDHALAMLPGTVRLCIVLSYHERMSYAEIAAATFLPLGTVKSHIRRGTEQLTVNGIICPGPMI